jgi:peptidoglycan hydrolase-like protein with peptidoglycan-binding domain
MHYALTSLTTRGAPHRRLYLFVVKNSKPSFNMFCQRASCFLAHFSTSLRHTFFMNHHHRLTSRRRTRSQRRQTVSRQTPPRAIPVDESTGKPIPRAIPVNEGSIPRAIPVDESTLRSPSANQQSAGPNLSRGSKGNEVRRLQSMLNQRLGLSLDVDGHFGPRTEAAVRKLQKSGQVGPKTWELLSSAGPSQANAELSAPETRKRRLFSFFSGSKPRSDSNSTTNLQTAARVSRAVPVTSNRVSHPSQRASQSERVAHYKGMLEQQGVKMKPGQTYVMGLRGLSPEGSRVRDTADTNQLRTWNSKGNSYNDSFVVLTPGRDGQHQATVLRGATYPGQKELVSNKIGVDANRDGKKDVGMVRPGVYRVNPNGRFNNSDSFRVKTLGGGRYLPGWRDTNQDGNYSLDERSRTSGTYGRMNGILFHSGNETSPNSVGCQTLSPAEYENFVKAVGGKNGSFTFALIDANQ